MKKVLLTAAILGCSTLYFTASAQEDKEVIIAKDKAEKEKVKAEKDRKETQEIVIRKKGDKDTKVTVEIKGDVVTINGKPLSEFKDGDITINKRNIRVWDGKQNFAFAPGQDMELLFDGPFSGFGETKAEPRAFLGVTTNTITDDSKEKMPNGAEITNVSKGSAAEKAGLKEGDIITKINDKKIESPGALSEAIGEFKPKDEITVYYKRGGKDMSAKAILGETKSRTTMAYSFNGPNGNLRSFSMPRTPMAPHIQGQSLPDMESLYGDALGNLDAPGVFNFPRHQKLGLKIQDVEEGDGVKVLDVDKDSPAEKAGLQKDDVVTEIAGKKITNTDDAREQLQDNAEKSAYNIKAKRNGKEMSFDIKIPKKLKTANL